MKSKKILIVMFFIVSFSTNASSQLWKQYSDSANDFSDQIKIDKAIEYFIKAKEELQRDSIGTLSYARTINNIAICYYNKRQNPKAESLFIEAKNIREKVVGKEHPDYAESCNFLANLYSDIGQYAKAELLFLEAKRIRGKTLGKEHPSYAKSCYDLGVLYYYMGQYEKVEINWLESKQIREKALGKEHPSYAESSNGLAFFYETMGQYEKAEQLFIESKNIREKVYGKVHPDYAGSCNNLAGLYYHKGQYSKAEPLYIESKQIREKIFGNEHPDYAASCNNLAVLYSDLGQYEKSEELYLISNKINEKMLGKGDPNFAAGCNNLASLYLTMGQYEKAEALYLEAREIFEKINGKDNISYADCCNNLAILYSDMKQYKKSETLHIESKQIREKILGKENPAYASSCNGLANLYIYLGQFDKSELLYLEALKIKEKTLGKDNLEYAGICYGLARLYNLLGQYEKARPLHLEAKQIREKMLGKDHLEYTASCFSLAGLYWNLKEYEKAHDLYLEAFTLEFNGVKRIFKFTSEIEKNSYLKNIAIYEKNFLSFNKTAGSSFRQDFSYGISITKRNLTLSSSQHLRQAIHNTSDTTVKNKFNNWIDLREQLSYWYTKPIGDRPEYVKEIEEQANNLEKELTLSSSDFKGIQSKNEITWKAIQQNLKINEAAIEFIEFNYYDGKWETDSTYYIALLLRKDKLEPVQVQLFEKKRLDTLLSNKKYQTTNNRINALYTGNKSLYNLTWKPLEKYLTGISKVYFASAGNLFKISFAALPVNDKQVLGDKYQLIQLNTTASVTDNTPSFITTTDNIQLYGGIKYDADSATLKQAVASYQSNTENVRSLPSDLERGAGFQYLPGTQQETEAIRKQAGNSNALVTALSEINATEESVKALNGKNSPSVLHIATHGFFFPDPKDDKSDDMLRKFETSGKAFKQSDNPLFRSGLLFAGANNAWQGKPIKGIEDGILTAYEVSNLYLPNTKLVVLSACETALGDIQGSEGVYGLQRAFKMAGVQNLVMSLWKVPDAETAEFMQVFYKNLFAKQTISNAFYNAQQVMKNKYRAEPYKWAAWVLVR